MNEWRQLCIQVIAPRKYSLLVSDLVAFAYKALFVFFTHVGVEFVVSKEALSTEFTNGMNTSLRRFFQRRLAWSLIHGR